MLNRYQQNLDSYIEAQQMIPLMGFVNRSGNDASWTDDTWIFQAPNGEETVYCFTNPLTCKKSSLAIKLKEEHKLPEQIKCTLMAYVLEINTEDVRKQSKLAKLFGAKKLLCSLNLPLFALTQKTLNAFLGDDPNAHLLSKTKPFIEWGQKMGFIRKSIYIPKCKATRLDGAQQEIANKEKLPDEEVLVALAAIFNEVIPLQSELKNWKPNPRSNQRDSFVAGMAALAMSSANRIAAEQTVLVKQSLKEWDGKTSKEDVEHTVHYLDWRGSKGYKDNRNHILAAMAAPVHRTMEYFNIVCETGRILCRFYENPDAPLIDIIGEYTNDKIQYIDTSKSVHLLMLGYLLGFYDDESVLIYLKNSNNKTVKKPIQELVATDILHITPHYSLRLLGSRVKQKDIDEIIGQNPTVAEFQARWIRHIKSQFPQFPFASNGAKDQNVRLSSALFCFTGSQLVITSAAYPMAKSFYGIVPVNGLATLFASRLNSSNRMRSIFQDYFGVDCELAIRPHQFRHWINDTAEKSGIPRQIISLFSGRVDSEQTLTYIHTTDEEKVQRVRFVFDEATKDSREIKIVTKEEYERVTKMAASVTATGFCTQDLTVTPCDYLNDFVFQCSLCGESCHVNRDLKSIESLKKDLKVQHGRLEEAKNDERLLHSSARQEWFLLHHRNTAMLEQLINLMQSTEIKEGSPIRYVANPIGAEFRISDLAAKTVHKHKALLPDSKRELALSIENLKENTEKPTESQSNTGLLNLFEKFGLTGEE